MTASGMFPVLIHADLYRLFREIDRAARNRVRKTLLRLRDGHWASGTRVKRLAGVRRAVFEARTDLGDRILFTVVRSASRDDPGRLVAHLQVWDLVAHDHVTRTARRNPAPDAEFLELAVLESFDITEPPPAPAATLDEVAPPGEPEPLLHYLLPPSGFEAGGGEDIAGAVRWYVVPDAMLADDQAFQRVVDEGGPELELKLTQAQYEVSRAPGPALVAGSAGSGKTTIAVHRLAAATRLDAARRFLYLSYSRWLVDHARSLYRDLRVAAGADPDRDAPEFLSFAEAYQKIIPREHRPPADRLMTVERFRRWLRQTSPRLDPDLVWEEIRAIVKGACLATGRPMLDAAHYFELGRKRAPLFVAERPEIFRVAERYQAWLTAEGACDQIDLCRLAMRELKRGRGPRYDAVMCDEVQDLTEIEMAFVLALSAHRDLSGVMLAGDVQQIVNPSGFRWAEARQAVLQAMPAATRAPALLRLRRNFRSVRPLVDLANRLLALRREVFGRGDEDDPEEAVVEGPVPIQVADSEERALRQVAGFGPRCAVLVLDDEEGGRLRARLDTTRVFHVREAKGLEFDSVILWKVLSADPDLVRRAIARDPRLERDAHFKQVLQLLYVAVTRARRHLAVFEGDELHPFWSDPRFKGSFETETAATLGRLFRSTASPADWAKEGHYYFGRERYRQAAECYRRAGAEDLALRALAFFAEAQEDWIAALERWQAAGDRARQAPLFERLGRYDEALEAYRETGATERAALMEIHLLEGRGHWAEAGRRWEEANRPDDALRCYRRSGNRARTLSFEAAQAEARKDWARAGDCYFSIKSWEAAARCFRKARQGKRAALATGHRHEQAQAWAAAATAFARAGEREAAMRCRLRAFEAAGKLGQAAALLEKTGDRAAALAMYRRAGDHAKVAAIEILRFDPKTPQVERVEAFLREGQWDHASALARHRLAALGPAFARIPWRRPQSNARRLFEEHRRLVVADARASAECAERDGDWKRAAAWWHRAGDVDRAGRAQHKGIEVLADPRSRGVAWLRAGAFERAIEAFGAAGDAAGRAEVRARQAEASGRWKDAAVCWKEAGFPREEARCLAQEARGRGEWLVAAAFHTSAGQRTLARQALNRARTAARDAPPPGGAPAAPAPPEVPTMEGSRPPARPAARGPAGGSRQPSLFDLPPPDE
jgi:tetratricopeptide (TPR) repeat protein